MHVSTQKDPSFFRQKAATSDLSADSSSSLATDEPNESPNEPTDKHARLPTDEPTGKHTELPTELELTSKGKLLQKLSVTRRGKKRKKVNKGVLENLSVLGTNANGLKAKKQSLLNTMKHFEYPSIVLIQETKLRQKGQIKLDQYGYEIFESPRAGMGGGCALPVRAHSRLWPSRRLQP